MPLIRRWFIGVAALTLVAGPLEAQELPWSTVVLPSGIEPLGLVRAPGNGALVTTRREVLQAMADSVERLRLGAEVDAITMAEPGLAVAVRADTLGIALLGEDGFQPLAMLPYPGLIPTVTNDGRLLLYGEDTRPDSTQRSFVFEVLPEFEIHPVAAIAEPIHGVVARGDTLFIASPRLVYRLVGETLEPFFADRTELWVQSMSSSPNGSLLLATSQGLLEVAADGSSGRWLLREPVVHVLGTRDAIYILRGFYDDESRARVMLSTLALAGVPDNSDRSR